MNSKVYPDLGNPISLTSGAAWTYGNLVEVIPPNSIATTTGRYVIIGIEIESITPTGFQYEISFYLNNSDTIPLGSFRFAAIGGMDCYSRMLQVENRLYAKVASTVNGATIKFSIRFKKV